MKKSRKDPEKNEAVCTKEQRMKNQKYLSEMLQGKRQWVNIFKVLEGKDRKMEQQRETVNLEFYT